MWLKLLTNKWLLNLDKYALIALVLYCTWWYVDNLRTQLKTIKQQNIELATGLKQQQEYFAKVDTALAALNRNVAAIQTNTNQRLKQLREQGKNETCYNTAVPDNIIQLLNQ